MAMGKTNNPEILNGLFEGGNFPNAQIVVMTGDGVHVSYMAELLEPEKGKHHPVRNQLGLVPDDNKVKKAVEEVFKRHGVEVP